jgi:hypothetical protein
MKKSVLFSTRQAAEILGVNEQRIRAMIAAPCPRCGGDMTIERGKVCPRCRGTGRRLPAQKLGSGKLAPWMIFDWGLELEDIRERKPGRPK